MVTLLSLRGAAPMKKRRAKSPSRAAADQNAGINATKIISVGAAKVMESNRSSIPP